MQRLHSLVPALALLTALLIVSCGGGSSGGQPSPASKAATNTAVPTTAVPTTAAPATTAPTTVPVSSSPTSAPKVAVSTATPEAGSISVADAAVVLPAAMAKTRGATTFRAHEEMTMDQPFGATRDNTTLLRFDAEIVGKDMHMRVGGTMVALLGLEPTDTLELVQAGGKGYVHGPAPALGAPENQWYVLPSDSGMKMGPGPFDTFDDFVQLKPDYSAFRRTNSLMNGVSCDIYTADKNVANTLWTGALYSATGVNPVVDEGSVEMSVCSDGYLHGLTIDMTGHDPDHPEKKGKAYFLYGFTDFGGNMTVSTPPSPAPATTPTNPFAPDTPTPEARGATPTRASSNGSTNLEGEWEGTTAMDDPISFTVRNNRVTNASLNLSIRAGSCSAGMSIALSVSNGTISNNKFTGQMKTPGGTQITLSGTFSGGQATGTLDATGTVPCDVPEVKTTWTAQNTSSEAPQSTATVVAPTAKAATPRATSGATSTGPIAVVDAFFKAINNKNADAAVALVDDNLIFTLGSPNNSMGKANLASMLAVQISSGMTYTISNYQAVGTTIVKFTAQKSDGTVYASSQAILTNGKIQILTLK